MKSKTRKSTILTLIMLCVAANGYAELINRGSNLIYDTIHDITWYMYSYYGITGGCGQQYIIGNYINGFECYDSVRDVTWTDWRLPSALNMDGTGPDSSGGNSEMATLFQDYGIDIFNPGPFIVIGRECNLNNAAYWTSTEGGSAAYTWAYSFWTGTQWVWDDGYRLDGMLVRDGDVGTHDRPPVANAGIDRVELLGTDIMLDGSLSSDEDGAIVSYEWILISSNIMAITEYATGVTPIITQLEAGVYDVTLTIADDDGLVDTDTMILIVQYGQAPVIKSICDVGNDDGRQVRLTWYRSDNDTAGGMPLVDEYGVYRRIDHYLQSPDSNRRDIANMPGRVSDKMAGWDYLYMVPARGDDVYECIVPTLCDSTYTDGICWSAFLVSAMTSDPHQYFDSAPDSGYSIDNLPPMAPVNFTVLYSAAGNALAWEPVTDKAVIAYCIYRSNDGSPLALVKETDQTYWVDNAGGNYHSVYELCSVDAGGNESITVAPSSITGLSDIMLKPKLFQNYPNPFNPETVIKIYMPKQDQVYLSVFDVSGKMIQVIMRGDMRGPGMVEAVWDGCDDKGHRVPSGGYFCQIKMGGYVEIIRMMLVK